MTVLREAADAAVRDHRLEPGVAAAAWSAAHTPRRLAGRCLAIAAGVLGAAGGASALVVWGTGGHPGPPAGGSACEGNVTTARLPSWARAGFSPAGLHTPHVLSDGGDIIAVL